MENMRIRGESNEEKFASIEAALKSLSRSVARRATIYIPPVPMFLPLGTGVIVPFTCKMKNLYVRASEPHGNLALTLNGGASKVVMNFTVSRRIERFDTELDIDPGMMLLVEGTIANAIVATALYPRLQDHEAKQYLLDEIMKQQGEEDAIQAEEK